MPTLPTSASRPAGASWNDWLPPACPDISGIDMWPDTAPWREDVSNRQVDQALTKRLAEAGVNKPIRTGSRYQTAKGVRSGQPFQLVYSDDLRSARYRKVYENKVPPSWTRGLFPSTMVPLPNAPGDWVRRFGDPTCIGTDSGAIFLDADERILYEISAFGPTTADGTLWRSGKVTAWDLDRDWREQPGGCTAAQVPLLPFVPTIEEYNSEIRHAFRLSIGGSYAKAPPIGFSRGTDGSVVGHPLRNGARLRMTEEAAQRLLQRATELTNHDLVHILAARRYGFVVMDQCGGDHAVMQPMDPRLKITIEYSLTDLEVLFP